MLIDVYDFDGTIYDGDSTADFVLFCLRRHPGMIAAAPAIGSAALRLAMKKIDLTQFKSTLFGEMVRRFDIEEEADAFWKSMKTRVKLGPWFFETPRDLPIVIASASPEFELRHAAKILGVETLIGTKCDPKTGTLIGRNCKGPEKIERIREVIGEFEVRAMYTDDAKADAALLEIAKERYIVTRGKVERQ